MGSIFAVNLMGKFKFITVLLIVLYGSYESYEECLKYVIPISLWYKIMIQKNMPTWKNDIYTLILFCYKQHDLHLCFYIHATYWLFRFTPTLKILIKVMSYTCSWDTVVCNLHSKEQRCHLTLTCTYWQLFQRKLNVIPVKIKLKILPWYQGRFSWEENVTAKEEMAY